MLPITDSGIYDTSQLIDWRIDHYASSMTVPETGLGFRIGTPTSSFTHSGMDAAANPATYMESNSTPVFTTAGGAWKYGRHPLVMDYWEAGAPSGVTRARYTVMHWRGYLSSDYDWLSGTGDFWFGVAGRGNMRIFYNSVEVLDTTILSDTNITYTSLLTGSASTQVDIYYWQLGENWGGLTCKFIPQENGSHTSPTDADFREAPVVSSSLFPYTTATATTLRRVTEATLTVNGPSSVMAMDFKVPLTTSEDSDGWDFVPSPPSLQYSDADGSVELKRGQLIKLYGGFENELYTRFTGRIVDFEENAGIATVRCESIESKLTTTNIENYPDRISYCTFNYLTSDSTSEPIRNVPAYDYWPLEYAVMDLCYKGGIDSRLLFGTKPFGTALKLFKAESLSGSKIKLQRQPHYGNSTYDFDDTTTPDDSYIYQPDASKSPLDWIRSLTDGFGYDFRSSVNGDIVLTSHHLPNSAFELTGGTQTAEPAAFGGVYSKYTSTFNTNDTVYAARIDLVVGRKSTLGVIDYQIELPDTTVVATGTVDLALAGETSGIFVYDDRFTVDGDNACIVTLFTGDYGEYVVKLSDNSGSEWWLNALYLYDADPQANQLAEVLRTDKAVLSLNVNTAARDARNKIVVIGKRKAAITDSEKFRNPNNPQYEFFVSTAVDASSIYDPDYELYVGGEEVVVIVDDTITDQDFADWVSQTLLFRQRAPDASPTIQHTIIPTLEPRDCLSIYDVKFGSIDSTVKVWVESFTENYTINSARSQITLTAYEPVPSFEPVSGLSLSRLNSLYGGNPAINFSITYPSIDTGQTKTNPAGGLPTKYTELEVVQVGSLGSDGNGTYVDCSGSSVWPPMPDTIALYNYESPGDLPASSTITQRSLRNNPYAKFWHIYDYSVQRIHVPFLAGDGTTEYGRTGTWNQNGGWSFSTYTVSYRGLPTSANPYSGASPFYDPYTSELPDAGLVEITFDALVTGYYRVSLWAVRNQAEPVPVGFLTELGADQSDPDKHWEYHKADKNKLFVWDGVDLIGRWNEIQSEEYSWEARGAFDPDNPPRIGAGFYVWNDHSRDRVTISGQKSSGKLVFNDDSYAQFYIKVECRSDVFADQTDNIRTVSSDQLSTSGSQNPQEQMYVYTYLPPPTRVTISTIEDWDYSYGAWDEYNPSESGWTSSPDTGATIRDGKPIRFTYAAQARPGNRFGGDADLTTFKLFRSVHLNANIFDMFMIDEGVPWNNASAQTMRKRLVCRKLTNSDKTVTFADTNFRRGDTLSTAKWVFQPSRFKIDDVAIRYCDYLQLEEVPSFSLNRQTGSPTSRFIMGYMNYLFYCSAYVQDRSGRYTGVIDTNFVDKSKITNNTFGTTFPENGDRYFNQTIVTRQWNDPDYIDDMVTKWSITNDEAHKKYIQFFWQRLESNDTSTGATVRLNSTGGAVTGNLNTAYTDLNSTLVYLPGDFNTSRQLGSYSDGSPGTLVSYFGSWTWEGELTNSVAETRGINADPLWIPCPTRDWHGYYLIPPMGTPPGADNPPDYVYEVVRYNGDEDPSATEVWAVGAVGHSNDKNFWLRPGQLIEDLYKENEQAYADSFNYTRQDELLHYEEFRGWRTGAGWRNKNTPRGPIIVQPAGGKYFQTCYLIDEVDHNRITTGEDRQPIFFTADVTTRPSSSVRSWFTASFRHKYNWESARFFPVSEPYGAMWFEHMYNEWELTKLPDNCVYDPGAWVGWRDDSGGTKLRWNGAGSFLSPSGGEGHGEDNIFISDVVGTYAVGPQVPERKDMMVSLVLENRRRKTPV